MLKIIDGYLNQITMYRLVFYCLLFLLAIALFMSLLKFLPFEPIGFIASALFIFAVCVFVNYIFAWAFGAPSNIESVYITALILALIITPANPLNNLALFIWAPALAMASKYILAIGKKHIFNPAALAVALTALTINQAASWWVGNLYMAPFVLFFGWLIIRKIKREDLVISFFVASLAAIAVFALLNNQDVFLGLKTMVLYSPLMFFAFVMLTEPATTPPRRWTRVIYGAFVGVLMSPAVHIGSLYSTPELALLVGNIFAYIVSPKQKLILQLKEKIRSAPDVLDFVFGADKKLAFLPGQYMEWTLEHQAADSRGIRRYFTLASSPQEKDARIGVKFYAEPSTFKKALMKLKPGQKIVAAQLAGDFTLPKDKNKKLVFVAGGIGVTPFRSIIKDLLDKDEPRPIIMFYSNKFESEIVYKEVFDEAERRLGIRTIYNLTDESARMPEWPCYKGRVSEALIQKAVPDYKDRIFYLSGPHAMVTGFESILKKLGVSGRHIKTDYFPGFA